MYKHTKYKSRYFNSKTSVTHIYLFSSPDFWQSSGEVDILWPGTSSWPFPLIWVRRSLHPLFGPRMSVPSFPSPENSSTPTSWQSLWWLLSSFYSLHLTRDLNSFLFRNHWDCLYQNHLWYTQKYNGTSENMFGFLSCQKTGNVIN